MTDKKQLFPIKTNTACLWKWAYSTIYFHNGTTSSCTYAKKLKIPENNFNSFHNLPEKIEDRQQMSKGLWPKNTCGYCSKIEASGGLSERMSQLDRQNDTKLTPPELVADNSAVEVTPTIIEVYFRNTCNMSCVYCGPDLSSKWEQELKLYGPMEPFNKFHDEHDVSQHSEKNKLYAYQKQQFWDYLKKNDRFKILRQFNLLGGEPLVIPELQECIDFWNNHPNENLVFQIHTNLKTSDYRFDKFLSSIEKLTKQKKIYQFKIVASIDGLGPQQEYVRYGMDTKQWISNFEKLLKLDNVSVGINSCISALTLHEFPFLLEKIIEWNKDRKTIDRIVHSFAIDTTYTTPYMFDIDIFKNAIERCKELFIVKNKTDSAIKKRWEGFVLTLNKSIKDVDKINGLKKYLSELDKRRNTDWKKTFSWLNHL